MQAEPFLKCSCQSCGGHIEFPAEAKGQTIACPHCGWETELRSERKPASTSTKRNSFLIAMLISIALIAALAFGVVMATKNSRTAKAQGETNVVPIVAGKVEREEPGQPRQRKKRNRKSTEGAEVKSMAKETLKNFSLSDVTIENSGGRLIYAVGSLQNGTPRQRFGVKVQLNLFNAAGKKIGSATDYTQIIEPNSEWHFRALVTDPKTTRAEIASIHED